MPDRVFASSTDMRLASLLGAAGYKRVEPPLLIDADLVRDLVGEALTRRLFLTSQDAGEELCLRPDYTIPVVGAHLSDVKTGKPAAYSYLGPVFRRGEGVGGELRQAGVESLGRQDRAAADADVVALAMDGARLYVRSPLTIAMGDVSVFANLMSALDLTPAWRRRLTRDFRRNGMLDDDIERLAGGIPAGPGPAGLMAALDGAAPQAARALVADLISIAGVATVGGRTAGDIADRFLDQAQLSSTRIDADKVTVIRKALAVSGDPIGAERALRAIAREAGVDLSASLDALSERNELLAARGVRLASATFSTRFGRDVDYYTGLVFEIHDPTGEADGPLVGGGRYDRLTEMMGAKLGSATDVPAVGCAFWVERLSRMRPSP